jgi:hypothetical protein
MATQIIKDSLLGGMPIKVEADSPEQALEILNNESPEQVRARVHGALRERQSLTGISDEDIEAIMNGNATYQDLPNKVQAAWLGFGKWSHEHVQGARQRYLEMTGDEEGAALIGSESADAEALFNAVDEMGISDEVGSFLGETALFLGGGSAKLGMQLLRFGLTGAAMGATQTTADGESTTSNAAWGAAFNSLIPASRIALRGLFNGRNGEVAANAFGVIASGSTGNAVGASISAAHLFQTLRSAQASAQAAMAAARRSGARVAPNMVVANRVATQSLVQLQKIVSRLQGSDASNFIRSVTQSALDKGIDPQTGIVNPTTIYHYLGRIMPGQAHQLGAVGDDLLRYRNAIGQIASLGSFEPQLVSRALTGLLRNPEESRGIAMALYNASKPKTQEVLLNKLADLAVPRAAGAAAMQNVGQGAENLLGETINPMLGFEGEQNAQN